MATPAERFGIATGALSLAYGTIEVLRKLLKYRKQSRRTERDVEMSEIGVQYDIFETEFELRSETGSTTGSQSSAFEGLECFRENVVHRRPGIERLGSGLSDGTAVTTDSVLNSSSFFKKVKEKKASVTQKVRMYVPSVHRTAMAKEHQA